MLSIISLLIVVSISILLTRIASIALTHTGLSQEIARFQARSAMTGAGFTTTESERVVNHPVRRRIILLLMLVGNVGIVGAMSSLILTFIGSDNVASITLRVILLVAGLVMLWAVAMSQWVNQRLSRFITWALKRYTRLDITDYASLMHLAGEYRIAEIQVRSGDWLANKTLEALKLRDEGIMVLGVTRRNGRYLGVPQASTKLFAGDALITYGRVSAMQDIDRRRDDQRAELDQQAAISRQQQAIAEEEQSDTH